MTKNDESVTKKYLDKKLEETKDYTDKKFREIKGEITGVKGEVTELKGEVTELKGEVTELKGEMVGFKDEILNEIKALREDFDAHAFQHQTTNDTLDDHETRIRRLEKPRL